MVIKLIPVKSIRALSRVANYIALDKGHIEDYKEQGIFHNLRNIDLKDLTKEFEQNHAQYAVKRSNGNVAMHVILSVSPLDRDKMNLEIMDDITRTYLGEAYSDALAFGAHHQSEDHWHSHLLVSANRFMSARSTRLSKSRLKEVHMKMLEHIREKHPQLTTDIDRKNWGRKLHSERAYYKEKRNPDLQLIKDQLSTDIQEIFRTSDSSRGFYGQLEKAGYATYNYKDRVQGIFYGDDNRKMRFSRLGVKPEQIKELDRQYERLQELEEIRDQHEDRDRENEIQESEDAREDEVTNESESDQEQDQDHDHDMDIEP